jgi:hypothetical protein
MLNITVATAAEVSRSSLLHEALQAYERRFGAAPEWLDELPGGRILSLVQQALQRGAPLIAAELLH